MVVDVLPLFAEPAKIIGSAIAGAIATLFVTHRLKKRKKRLQVDIPVEKRVGGAPAAVGIKVTFEGESYDSLGAHLVEVKNIGMEEIDDVKLIFCAENGTNVGWFLKVITPDGAHRAEVSFEFENGYLTVDYVFLNPGQSEQFLIIANCTSPIEVRSRTKGADFVDLREKRERALGIGMKLLSISRRFTFL